MSGVRTLGARRRYAAPAQYRTRTAAPGFKTAGRSPNLYGPFRPVIPRSFPTARYTTKAYSSDRSPQTLDLQFTGAYAAGVYTVDTQPLQMLPINTTTNVCQSLNLIQQGDGIAQRRGNKVALKSLKLKLGIQATGVTLGGLQRGRIMIIYDRAPNGAYAASNTILANALQANTIGNGDMWSDIDPDKFDRYTVLMNELIVLQPLSAALTSDFSVGPTMTEMFIFERYIKLKNLECVYGSTSNPATIANQTIGSLQILVLGDLAANSEPWQLRGGARLRFYNN